MAVTTITNASEAPLGSPVPPFTPHAISVSLPTWRDNVGYEEGDKRVMNAMVCGYPRFFINPVITKVRSESRVLLYFSNVTLESWPKYVNKSLVPKESLVCSFPPNT